MHESDELRKAGHNVAGESAAVAHSSAFGIVFLALFFFPALSGSVHHL